MKKLAIICLLAVSVISCKKESNSTPAGSSSCGNPSTAAPAGLAGNWASGYGSFLEMVDTYNGQHLGSAWSSGKFFKFTNNGKAAEFYYMVESQTFQSGTKATGTIAFDEGSTMEEGSFTFYPCWAHYKGWSASTTVDRDATSAELQNNLTIKFFYLMDGEWLRIEPNGVVNNFSSSFRTVN
ncbi:MAG: hypothetical protein V4685_18290 [Bacteroidota bacterium]